MAIVEITPYSRAHTPAAIATQSHIEASIGVSSLLLTSNF
jgi:hypothetical protein